MAKFVTGKEKEQQLKVKVIADENDYGEVNVYINDIMVGWFDMDGCFYTTILDDTDAESLPGVQIRDRRIKIVHP